MFQIDLVAHLPVGTILEDHPTVFFNVTFKHNSPSSIYNNLTERNFESYLSNDADGLLSEVGPKAQAFLVSNVAKSNGEVDWPDLRFAWEETQVDSSNGITVTRMGMVLGRPSSSGSLKLDTDAYLRGERRNFKLCLIDYNLLGNNSDQLRLIDGMFEFNYCEAN